MDDLTKIDVSGLKKKEWLDERDVILAELSDIETVESDSELTVAGTLQTKASKHLKVLEKARATVKAPVIKLGKDIEAQAKELGLELAEGVTRIRCINSKYATKVADEAEAARLKLENETAEAARVAAEAQPKPQATFGGVAVAVEEPEAEVIPAAPLPTGKVHTGANRMVKVWTAEVVNALLVPDEYKTIDMKKVNAFGKYKNKMGDIPEIPGIRFTSTMDVQSR